MSHWALSLLGKPWRAAAEGPDAFDCWGFVRFVWREHFGFLVPMVTVDDYKNHLAFAHAMARHAERENWTEVDAPSEGDAVLMARAQRPCHVGIWLEVDGGGVLHCVEHAGVIFSRPSALLLSGWGSMRYLRHAGCNR